MLDIGELGRQLEKSGKGDTLKALAESSDGQKLLSMVDADVVERAAKSGNVAAMQGILSQLLSTGEGRRLAAAVQKAIAEGKGK